MRPRGKEGRVFALHRRKCCHQTVGGGLSLLFSIGEDTAGVLCIIWGFPLEEIHGLSRAGPLKGHSND